MNDRRHYPQAFKFAMVALLAFNVIVFFYGKEIMVKLYCVVMFVAILNAWITSEQDSFVYGDTFLLIDAFCSALYFLTLLELNEGKYEYFWLYSSITFFMYRFWNILLVKRGTSKLALHKYNVCDLVAGIYSLFAFVVVKFSSLDLFTVYVQYIGMVLWIAVLLVWYYDFYIRKLR